MAININSRAVTQQAGEIVAPDDAAGSAASFYKTAIRTLLDKGVPFLVGGAYALRQFTGVERYTKDFDIFVRPGDAQPTLDVLSAAGYGTEILFPHWLGKAYAGDAFIDVIFSSGNGVALVDDDWFRHAVPSEVLGLWVELCPPEETIWSKSFVAERERYDGADVAHLIRSWGPNLDWGRLLVRFGGHWRVLLSHLVLFGFVYPGERERVPRWVMDELLRRVERELSEEHEGELVCNGTLLSREQYLTDLERWGYEDARLRPEVNMTAEDIAHWTDCIPWERLPHGQGHAQPRRSR